MSAAATSGTATGAVVGGLFVVVRCDNGPWREAQVGSGKREAVYAPVRFGRLRMDSVSTAAPRIVIRRSAGQLVAVLVNDRPRGKTEIRAGEREATRAPVQFRMLRTDSIAIAASRIVISRSAVPLVARLINDRP